MVDEMLTSLDLLFSNSYKLQNSFKASFSNHGHRIIRQCPLHEQGAKMTTWFG